MDQTSGNEKLDYLPTDIMNCLAIETEIPIFDRNIALMPSKKAIKRGKEDVQFRRANIFDVTSIRKDEMDKLNVVETRPYVESIIPNNYHLIKEDLRRFIEYSDRELESLDEIDKRQIIFPTERPHSRHEVKCLDATLRRMLNDCDQPDQKLSSLRIETRDDIDHVIKYVERQEEVYNIILHELGRQVMTFSYESGSTVLELRHKYSDLVNKIPEELLRLKDEVKEQVIKDSKLLSQIEAFQADIIHLTDHLKEVKNLDIKVTQNANSLQKELEAALQDSDRSKELLNEYHVLYDLQRQRLDNQMSSINIEKEEWSSLAFALALKVSDESLLTTSKRIRLITKKLIQLSQHFAIFISDCDTVITTKIQDLSDRYLKMVTMLFTDITKLVNNFYDLFHFLKSKFQSFARKEMIGSTNHVAEVLNQIGSLKGFLADEVLKKFTAEVSSEKMMAYVEGLDSMNLLTKDLKSLINEVSGRNAFQIGPAKESLNVEGFIRIYSEIDSWAGLIQSKLNVTAHFQNFFLDFQSKVDKIELEIKNIMEDRETKGDERNTVESILVLIDELYMETFQSNAIINVEKNENFSNFVDYHNGFQATMKNFITQIDGFDASIIENINVHQDNVTHWIVDILFLLSSMSESSDLEKKYQDLCHRFSHLISFNGKLFDYVSGCTEKFVTSSEFEESYRQAELEEYKIENNNWNDVAEILIRNIGEKIEQELLKKRKQSQNIKEDLNMENIDELLEKLTSKSTDENIYLSIKSVLNLKSEVEETEKRIREANKNKEDISLSLQETKDKIVEFENKIEELTNEHHDYTKV